MDCPDQEKIQAVILEEATEPERSELIEHIEQCSSCQEIYHQYTVLFKGIESVVDNEECVPWQELKAYAEGKSSDEQKAGIEEHVRLCHDCDTLLGFYQDPAKAKAWEEREQKIFEQAHAEEIAKKISKRIIDKLLPGKVDFKQAWEYASKLFENISDIPLVKWPKLQSEAVAGALGFSGPMEPETMGAINIDLIALGVAQNIVQGKIDKKEADVSDAIKQYAEALGAGKQLQKRFIESTHDFLTED